MSLTLAGFLVFKIYTLKYVQVFIPSNSYTSSPTNLLLTKSQFNPSMDNLWTLHGKEEP